jgi:accessory gene regulator protein AgrB
MSTLILLVSLILLLINPAMLLQIIALAIIFALILIYYISYKINRSTRMAENKNYWANFNPSKDTLDDL